MLSLILVLVTGFAHAGPCADADMETCGRQAINARAAGDLDPAVLERMEAACFGGYARACTWYAWELAGRQHSDLGDMAKSRSRSKEAFAHACSLDYGPGCAGVGSLELEWPEKKKPDMELVRTHFDRACTLESGHGCRLLGDFVYRGLGKAEPDRDSAAELYLQACTLEDEAGCTQLAVMVEGGLVAAPAGQTAQSLLEAACAGEEPGACALLAMERLEEGDREALRDLKDACNRNSSMACATLGHAYVSGFGTDSDRIYGMALLRKACTPSKGIECRYAGCERESPLACRWLGLALAPRAQTRDDEKLAEAALQLACSSGDAVACEAVAK